jgi:anti-anti-sigma factor
LIADLSELSFIDSSGVGSLLRAKEHVEAAGNQLLLARPSPAVRHLFEVLGLDGLFDDSPLA